MSDLERLFSQPMGSTPRATRPRPFILTVMVVGLGAGGLIAAVAAWLLASLPYRHDAESAEGLLMLLLFPFGDEVILATGLFRVPASMATDNAGGVLATLPFGFLLALPITVFYCVAAAAIFASALSLVRKAADRRQHRLAEIGDSPDTRRELGPGGGAHDPRQGPLR